MKPENTLAFLHSQKNRYRICEGFNLRDDKRYVLAKHLTDILGGETQRYEFTYLLFGGSSTARLASGEIRALLDLLQVERFQDLVPESVRDQVVNLHQFLLSQVNRSFLKETLEESQKETLV